MPATKPQNATAKFASIVLFALAVMLTQPAQAQTFTVLHSFAGGSGGATPYAGVTLDAGGNLYGTTLGGGYAQGACSPRGCGTVYRLKRAGSGWTLSSLYSFHDNDGNLPQARVVFGPDGTLFGTTNEGGYQENGLVFNLRPPSTVCKSVLCPWTETVLHEFGGNSDGCLPYFGDLTFDAAGHLYGTTADCGQALGTVFELARQPSGSWLESILYDVDRDGAGEYPFNSVIFDTQGNLYTTTEWSIDPSDEYGTVIQMVNSPSGWTGTDLHVFSGGSDGGTLYGGLVFDQAGNLYGNTFLGGEYNGGTVFELSPSNGGWAFNVIYNFTGLGPWASMVVDAAGNLYGTTTGSGAFGHGNVFKLTPSDGDWTYTSLHDFAGGSDGGFPVSVVSFDANGNLYGTASQGGISGSGVIWEITP